MLRNTSVTNLILTLKYPNNFQLRAREKKTPNPKKHVLGKELSQRLILVERMYFSIPAIYCYIILTMYNVPLITQTSGIGSEKQNKKLIPEELKL